MNPMVQDALGSILRWLLALGAGWLVQHNVWTQADASTYVAAAAVGLLSLGWSLWQKYKSRLKLLTALGSSTPMTELHVERVVALGVNVPSATTSAAVVPKPS